jgi:hypothetical protein
MDAVTQYIDTRQGCIEIAISLARIGSLLEKLGYTLKTDPDRAVLGHGPQDSQNMPARGVHFDMAVWKSPEEIADLLCRYGEERRKALTLWSSLPSNTRAHLTRPPGAPWD